MANFFVGQRVRIVYAPGQPQFVGVQSQIVGVADGAYLENGYEWLVLLDGETWGANSEHLEPILPDGHRTGDFTNVKDLLDSLTREHA